MFYTRAPSCRVPLPLLDRCGALGQMPRQCHWTLTWCYHLPPQQAMDINLMELDLANRHLETEQQELEQVGCRALCVWGAEWEGGEEGRLPGLDLLR